MSEPERPVWPYVTCMQAATLAGIPGWKLRK